MIRVKGTQTSAENTDPAAPYARKPEEKPNAVAKVSLMLVALVLSFKAFLSGRAEAEQTPAEQANQDAAGVPEVQAMSQGRQHQDIGGQGTDAVPANSFLSASFGLPSAPDSIAFGSAERQVLSPVFQPAGYITTQANDNGPPRMELAGSRAPNVVPDAGAGGSSVRPVEVPSESQPGTPPSNNPEPLDPDGNQHPEEEGDEDGDTIPKPTVNNAPRVTGPVILNDISGCTILSIGLAELLRGAIDPDGDALVVTDVTASSGELKSAGPGLWDFSPEGETGPVTITYRISDGSLAVDQTLHFAVVPRRRDDGTDQDDILIGTPCADDIAAGAGDDLVDGLAGEDIIRGAAGDDHIIAGAGDDLIFGGLGHDVIFGGSGHDEIYGGSGNDRLFGGAGNDILAGGSGDDMLWGGAGNDNASGGEGADRLYGEAGNDIIFGDAGNDLIEGGKGNDLVIAGAGDDAADGGEGDDRLMGGEGDDRLSGGTGSDLLLGEAGNDILKDGAGDDVILAGAGDDQVIAAADGADDRYEGGDGCDLLDYTAVNSDLEVDLAGGHVKGLQIGCDTITGFERIATGSGNDLIRLGGGAVSISGGEGRNTFEFADYGNAVAPLQGPGRQTSYEIEDFKVGDRLRTSQWEIFKNGVNEPPDMFDRVYGRDDDAVPIRYRSEWGDAVNETVIEVDLDGDDFFETAIILDGRHMLVLAETA